MHYGNHVRDAFVRWVDEGFPPEVKAEIRYEPVQQPARVFLRGLLHCSDQLPGWVAKNIRDTFPEQLDTWMKSTYGCAARRLLEIPPEDLHGSFTRPPRAGSR